MTALFIQSDGRDMTVWHPVIGADPQALLTEHEAGPVLWAHLKATLPTRDEPQPEPLDPAVRVRAVGEVRWGRIGERWVSEYGDAYSDWEGLLHGEGPLTIVTPTPEPTPDERPFKVGDKVRIDDQAVWVHHDGSHRVSPGRGEIAEINSIIGDHAVVRLQRLAGRDPGSDVRLSDLTHADAPC